MRYSRSRAVRFAIGLAAPLALAAPLLVGGITELAPASAATAAPCVSLTGGTPFVPSTTDNTFTGVTEISPCDVWAVGFDLSRGADETMTEHWNGTQWTVVPSPNPGGSSTSNTLLGLAVTSTNDAWAVGTSSTASADHTLILRWNGTSWVQVTSPTPDGSDQLRSASATSASNAWAVGASSDGTKTLILHWNGTSWKQVGSPSPTADNGLFGVAATSASNAWAVGFTGTSTLILAWNGTKWAKIPSPAGDQLNSVIGISASNAWAVGDALVSGVRQPLAIHCC